MTLWSEPGNKLKDRRFRPNGFVGDPVGDRELDHRMILHRDDPAVGVLRELGEPVVVVDFVPTVENLAKHIYEFAVGEGLPVVEVELWETFTGRASYSAE